MMCKTMGVWHLFEWIYVNYANMEETVTIILPMKDMIDNVGVAIIYVLVSNPLYV